MGINMNDIDTLLPTISECALALSETVEPYITEDQLPERELGDLIKKKEGRQRDEDFFSR